jgi:hypothetical protein
VLAGTDPEGDVTGAQVTFIDDANADVAYDDGFGGTDLIDMVYGFSFPIDGDTAFTAYVDLSFADFGGDDLTPAGASGFRVELVDIGENQSNSLTAQWSAYGTPAEGEACDPTGATSLCEDDLDTYPNDLACPASASVCTAVDTVEASVCAAAVPALPLDTPTMVGLVAGYAGGAFFSDLDGDCGIDADGDGELDVGSGFGPELVYQLVVAARSSLEIDTDREASAGADPVIYVRSACDGAVSEVGCHDDVDFAGGNYLSILTIDALEPGTYYVIADSWSAVPYEFLATLTAL